MGPYILAHRGSSGTSPENTLASFEKAAEDGADGIELDVHLSADGVPVVIHDETLERTTNAEGKVNEYRADKLRSLDAGSYFSSEFELEGVPTLAEVLELAPDFKVVNIELKNNKIYYQDMEEKVHDLVKSKGLQDKVLYSSFNHYSIAKLKRVDENISAGILYKSWIFEPWFYANRLNITNIHPHYLAINQEIVQKCHEHGIKVNVYGTNDEKIIRNLMKIGVDMVICDYPADVINIREDLK
ncbi:MAG: glycerophosphodiester phosphodiesterase [Bacillota bacterium]